jgi:hypothetical protein
VLGITWLQDTNHARTSGYDTDGRMNWAAANAWAATFVHGGYSDWRLPTVGPIGTVFDPNVSNNATTDQGYARTTTVGTDGGWRNASGQPVSELGHMCYVGLGLTGLGAVARRRRLGA